MPNNKPTMTSTEAAALYVSQGATDDMEKANLMQEGKLLDPDRLERAALRRALGFDFTIIPDNAVKRWIVRDDELGITVRTAMSDDDAANSQALANACIKLKKKHDKLINTPEGDTDVVA